MSGSRSNPNSPKRRSPSRSAPLGLALALVLSVGLSAQTSLVNRPIREIQYEGLATLPEDSLSFYLNLELGQPYDPGLLNEQIKSLWTKELIDDIEFFVADSGDGGVNLRIRIEERLVLVSLDYQGQKKVSRSDIGDYLDKQRIEIYEGLPLSKGDLARAQKAIEDLYAERGYRFADVAINLEPVERNEVRALVTVDEGNKVKIGKINFEGNDVFNSGKLRRQMKKTRESGLISRIRKRDVFNPATVEEDLEAVEELYKTFGYKDIQLGEPEVEVVEKKPNAKTSEGKKRQLSLVLPVEEGPRWKLGDINIEGNEILKDELLTSVFAEPKGGWLRKDVIDEGIEKIQEFYNNTGYIFAQVRPEIVEQENLIADLVINVDENDQFRVGRIMFDGNTRTQDRVLRRELRLQEGMVFNSGSLRSSLFKINQLEYYKLNEDEPVDLDYDVDAKEVNLVVKGQEAERTELQFGGGFSELDGVFGQASLRTRNFLGRGETVGFSLQTGRFRELFDVSYFVPWLRDRPQSIGLQVFKRDTDFDLFADQRFIRNESGATLTYGRSYGLFSSISTSYSFSDFEDFRSQRNTFANPDPITGEFPILEQNFGFTRSSLSMSYNYDSHNSRLEPTRGFRLRATLEYAGGVLGGEDYFIRPQLNVAYTKPLLKKGIRTVGRINFNIAYIVPFGTDDFGNDRELFFLNRFLLGGENSIRGFGFRSIWVRDPVTGQTIFDESGFPQGGDKMFSVNLEHHFVISGPFRLVLFADGGNVYGETQDIDLSHLRASAGIELRLNVPLFGAPLRFIYARNLDPLADLGGFDREQFDSFDFSIGTSF